MKVCFLYTDAFSKRGGIQSFNKAILISLHQLSFDYELDVRAISLIDDCCDERYFLTKKFKSFKNRKVLFFIYSFINAYRSDILIFSHINYYLLGVLIKLFYPNKKILLTVHGIEVWKSFSGYKLKFLNQINLILSVSNFTKNQILLHNSNISPEKIIVFPNTIDPYFNVPKIFKKPQYLLDRFGIDTGTKVIFSLSRIDSSELYKGYDITLRALYTLKDKIGRYIFILGGKADFVEKNRINKLISDYGLENSVLFSDVIDDSELSDFFLMSDLFVMPSKKEGFGIVFIEAIAHGVPVIGGNTDGSVEALLNGKIGYLVDPNDFVELSKTIMHALTTKFFDPYLRQKIMLENFEFNMFKKRLYSNLKNI
jgi:phosphatidylinositol alpha-1,6-mannosyltransferase